VQVPPVQVGLPDIPKLESNCSGKVTVKVPPAGIVVLGMYLKV
jgi:hypothetical protein